MELELKRLVVTSFALCLCCLLLCLWCFSFPQPVAYSSITLLLDLCCSGTLVVVSDVVSAVALFFCCLAMPLPRALCCCFCSLLLLLFASAVALFFCFSFPLLLFSVAGWSRVFTTLRRLSTPLTTGRGTSSKASRTSTPTVSFLTKRLRFLRQASPALLLSSSHTHQHRHGRGVPRRRCGVLNGRYCQNFGSKLGQFAFKLHFPHFSLPTR
jgi:hypothetical protein